VEISKADAEKFGFSDGDTVKVISAVGEVTTKLRVGEALPLGLLFMPISFPESPVNQLFGVTLDPKAKTPSLKRCMVRLERVSQGG
jgi:predicted molibdopterin-dependent oxidoreductase YjgC